MGFIFSRTTFETILRPFNSRSREGQVCNLFVDYLVDSQGKNIRGLCVTPDGEQDYHDFGYPHRWTDVYLKGRFAKMYLLEEWVSEDPGRLDNVTFLSLTVRQDRNDMGFVKASVDSIVKYWDSLILGWKRLRALWSKWKLHIDYVGVSEPHESGNPHFHVCVFHRFTSVQIDTMRSLWEAWGLGSYEHGLDFDVREHASIKSIRNYLLSYMLKSLPGYKSKFKDEASWTSEELLFNAVAWYFRYRTWFASNTLSHVMVYDPLKKRLKESEEELGEVPGLREFLQAQLDKLVWYETQLHLPDGEEKIIWKKAVDD